LNSVKTRRNILLVSLLMFSLISAFMSSASAGEVLILITADDFDDYKVKTYSGSDGPGMWLQDIGGGGSATYKIVSDGGRTFYKLESSDGVFVKAILPYYLYPIYMGLVDYTFGALMKVDSGEGGIIFRVQPVKIGESYYLRKYYLATVYKSSKKVVLWYVDETQGPGAGPVLAQADVPTSVDLDNWFSLSVTVKGSNIKVSIGEKQLINVNDARLTYGTVGLYTFKGCAASFDSVGWWGYVSQTTATTTVTTTITSTVTSSAGTVTETVTATETTTVGGGTVTETLTATTTATTTAPAETITQTKTIMVTEKTVEKVTETKTVTETKRSTVTSTVTEMKGLKCLIATAAFGSELAPQVLLLRGFRDGFVLKTFAGSSFMAAFNAFYYSWSPYVAKAEYEGPLLRSFIRASIYPLIYSLELSRIAAQPLSTVPELAVLVSGIIASLLIGLIYISPIAIAVTLIARRKGWRMPRFKITYLFAALLGSLAAFALAEITSSVSLMMLASALTVLSFIALGASLPALAIGYASGIKAFRQNRET